VQLFLKKKKKKKKKKKTRWPYVQCLLRLLPKNPSAKKERKRTVS
jgi:hypothetical protein